MKGKVIERYCLNAAQTWHVGVEAEEKLSFKPGDSLAITPKNNPEQVEALLEYFGLEKETLVLFCDEMIPAEVYFTEKIEINWVPRFLAGGVTDVHEYTLLSFLRTYHPKGFPFLEFQGMPLRPRLYSIASGPYCGGGSVDLLVAQVRYKEKFGPCSHYLTEHVPLDHFDFSISVHSPRKFYFPENLPLIMICAGTGVAPFRSFLDEVELGGASCPRAWLFFGERSSRSGFYYSDFFKRLEKERLLKLSLAFSRDQDHKIYVQHRMWDNRKELWHWIMDGATIMVCGSAQRMARDVDSMLLQIAMQEGAMSKEQGLVWLRSLHHENRYMRDIY